MAFSIVASASSDKKDGNTAVKEEKAKNVEPIRNQQGNVLIENENYQMQLEESTLGLIIKDLNTGFQYETTKTDEISNASWQGFMKSGVSVEFYSQKSTMPERVDLLKGTPKVTYLYYNDGFDAELFYETYDFHMTLEVRLTGEGMTAGVKKDSISEGETYKLGAIYLYPMLGATKLGEEEGYMLVPEGAGALIDLSDNHGKFKTPYTKKIFGENVGIDKSEISEVFKPAVTEPEAITVPVFGMIYSKKQQGFLGIVEEGQYNAEILAYPNGVTTEFNWITTKFHYREVYTMQTAASSGVPTYEKTPYMRDIKINYQFVSGDKADYTGLAKTYQSYLVDQGLLTAKGDKFQVKLDFFGADTKKWFIFHVVVPMTTVKQVDEITSDLIRNEITDILPVYTGWQAKGNSLALGSGKFKIERKLGDQKKLFHLIEKLQQKDIELVLNQDFLKANPSRFYNTSKDIVKGINQVIVEEPTNASVFDAMHYFTPSKSYDLVSRFKKRYDGTAVTNVGLLSITNELFSYYSGGDIYTRGDTAQRTIDIVNQFDGINLSLEYPNVYLWDAADQYFDMPMSTSNYSYLSKEIPFLPIVLKGYLPYWAKDYNFEANEKEFYLKMIEYGAYPSFLVTGESPNQLRNTNSSYIYTSEYAVLKGTIEQYYKEMGDVLRLVEGVPIKSHQYIESDVVLVLYDNGVQIYINYSDEDYKVGDLTVSAMSFSVK
jgi:hypothetical protein